MKLLSIIFSFRNEEGNIPELIERVSSSLKNLNDWNYELIFVNDDSTDNSEKMLLNLQKNHPIKIINMSRNFGVAPCIIAGFKHSKGDAVVYMDSDLQDPPEIIPNLVKEYELGNEIVHTVRTKRKGETKFKLIITKLAYKIINFLSDIDLPVEAGDFKLISRKALDKILEQKEFRPYVRGLSVFINGITSHSLKPLYLGIYFGFFSIIFSILLIIYALFAKFNNMAIPGSAGIIITISFFSGILLYTLGVIGIYIARIFEQTKGRDQYIIKDIKE